MNFAQVKGISIPQGTVKQLAQGQTVLWKKQIWPPASYTRLGALRRTASSAFFNTGVALDTSIDFDIYFSNPATRNTGNLAVFGIRRASGNTDTKNCCLYLGTNSYFSGPAVVYGGVDSSNISGGGSGTKFGGNLIKISKRGSNWYSWGRLIYQSPASAFTNTDGVPAFLGTPAKNATTVYGNSNFLSAWHEAVFYDSQGNITHRFLPYLNNNNEKGFWDTIAGEFKTVNSQSSWAGDATYTLRSVRLRTRFAGFGGSGSYQSATEKKGWQIAVQHTQRYFYLTNDTYEIHNGSMSQTGRTLECSEYNADWHGNGCWWSDTYADPDDYFPLLYVSSDRANHLLTVYRLAGSDPTTCTISLVQKIYTPEGDSTYGSTLYYHNYYGKAGCSTFLQTAYTMNSYDSNTGDYAGNVLMYRVFNLPALSAGSEVTLLETDALAKGDVGFYSTTSNGGWNGKYLYIGNPGYFGFWEISGNTATQLVYMRVNIYTEADYITTGEAEGISWSEERECFVGLWEPIYGNFYDVFADDLKPYAIGTYNFGQ